MEHFIKTTNWVAGNLYNVIKDGVIKNFNDLKNIFFFKQK